MSAFFDPRQGLVVVQAELDGPTGSAVLRLALDTGATNTVINAAMLVSMGYAPAVTLDRVQITTGSGVEFVPRIMASKIAALRRERGNFPILCHTLPPSSSIDGLLGLDFFRGHLLTIDFRVGQVDLS